MDSVQPAPPSETLVPEPPIYPPSPPLSQSLHFSSSETLAHSSQTSPPPQTLVSENNPIPSPQTLDQNDPNQINPNEPISPTPNSSSEDQIKEIQSSIVSENDGVVNVNLTQSGTEKDNSGGEDETSSRRRRRSRWDPPTEAEAENGGTKKRKSRWAAEEPKPAFQLPDFMKDFTGGIDTDPEIQALNARLLEISRILQSGCQLDDRPEGARSPSPEPLYDNMGIRINTREYRARERLNRERQEIISQIIKRNPSYRPPADYRPPKINKKLYIPMKEYPGYNFIGLIIGPRGNTQKRMEKETGAKIVIRGKGSIKEGRLGMGTKRDFKYDPAENEDLHVLVEGDTQEAVDAAAGMVEKLLRPVDEGLNEHKRQQLRELAALNGTIREDEMCRLCGESGHRQFACPARMSTFKSEVLCKICGDGGHPTIDCPVKGTVGKKMDDEYQNFLAELGGSGPSGPVPLTKQAPALAIMDSNSLGSNVAKIGKEIDDTNLYIGYLSPNFDDDALIRLFSPFGDIVMAKVIKDRVTGLSKGYGFVKYSDIAQANQAISSMNGYKLEGRAIAVRVAGKPPQPTVPPGPPPPPPMSTYLGPNQGASVYPSQQITSGGPLGNPPAGNYMGAPVPWRSSVPPPYAPYPVTHGSNMYASIQGQPMPPYGVRYPPPGQPLNMPSSEAQQSYPPGVQAEINGSAQSTPYRMYGNSIAGVPPNSQATYPPSSVGYPSYYGVSHSMMDPTKFPSGPWASNPPVPPPVSSAEQQSQQTTYGADPEYEKFMAEMK